MTVKFNCTLCAYTIEVERTAKYMFMGSCPRCFRPLEEDKPFDNTIHEVEY